MKSIIYLFLFFAILFISCDKDGLNGHYPDGVSLEDMETVNDCTLLACSEDRVIRLHAKKVKGEILKNGEDEYYVQYSYPIDVNIQFYFCDLPIEFQEVGMQVKFSGDLHDACGIKDPGIGGQEIYFLMLSSIKEV